MNVLNNPLFDISEEDRKKIMDFDPASDWEPPKVLANLFEAYVGALYWNGGCAAVFQWLITLVAGMHTFTGVRELATSTSQLSEYPLETYRCPDAVARMLSFISLEKDQLRKFGKRLRRSLRTKVLSFGRRGELLSPFSLPTAAGEGLMRINIFSGWFMGRPQIFFAKDGRVAWKLTVGLFRIELNDGLNQSVQEIYKLIASPAVLAHLARILALDDYIHTRHEVVSTDSMAYVLLSAVGLFERENNHQLFALEPLFALLAEAADHILGISR